MAGSYLGQPKAVRGESDVIDLSNSLASSVFLLRNPCRGEILCITRACGNNNILKQATGSAYADFCSYIKVFSVSIPGRFTHVHMHPDVVLFADVRNGDERVKGSVHCRSSSCTHKERNKTLHKQGRKMTVQKAPTDAVITAPMCFPSSLIIAVVSVTEYRKNQCCMK